MNYSLKEVHDRNFETLLLRLSTFRETLLARMKTARCWLRSGSACRHAEYLDLGQGRAHFGQVNNAGPM